MKVLIIGGMGIIGGAVTEAAAKKEFDVYVLSRRDLFGKYRTLGIKNIRGNWKDDDFAREAVKPNFDVIVDTLILDKPALIRDLDIANGHCKQFIYISTDSVYPHPDENVSEDNKIDIDNVKWSYGYKKREAELYLIDHSSEYSFFWTVIRPVITYGDTRIPVGFASRKNEWTLLHRMLTGKPIIYFDELTSVHPICHSSTFGDAAIDLFMNERAVGEIYHIADDKSYTYGEVLDAVAQVLGVEAKYIHAPVQVLKKYNKGKYEEILYDKIPEFTANNAKIKSVSPSTEYQVDIHQTMELTVNYLRENYAERKEDEEYNMLSDIIILTKKEDVDSQEERQIVDEYRKGFSMGYKIKLYAYGVKLIIKNFIKMIVRSNHYTIRLYEYIKTLQYKRLTRND